MHKNKKNECKKYERKETIKIKLRREVESKNKIINIKIQNSRKCMKTKRESDVGSSILAQQSVPCQPLKR